MSKLAMRQTLILLGSYSVFNEAKEKGLAPAALGEAIIAFREDPTPTNEAVLVAEVSRFDTGGGHGE